MKILKVSKIVTVILSDGTQLINTNVSDELFSEIKQCIQQGDEECVKMKMAPELCKEQEKVVLKKELYNNVNLLVDSGLFEIKNEAVYRKGIDISMPETLVQEFIKLAKWYIHLGNLTWRDKDTQDLLNRKEFKKLDNFWMWCSLNPNPESREDLFRFLDKHQMAITNDGMVLAYRRVVSKKNEKSDLVEFISNQYIKVKTIWKKNPENYWVSVEHGTSNYKLTANQFTEHNDLGNLKELYLNLPTLAEQQFTDGHTHSFDYRIGQEVRMPRSEGDQSNRVSCSNGFHQASKAYDYSGFGDTPILCAFNPMDVLAVPHNEDGKLRVCAFTPIAVLTDEEDRTFLDTNPDIADITTHHYQEQVNNLKELVSKNTAYELGINNILSKVSQDTIDVIKERIDMNLVVNNRVIDKTKQLSLFNDK